jgi:hypothetical protein
MEKKGEKVTPKNCYANPARPVRTSLAERVIRYSKERAKMDRPQTHTPKLY